MDLMCATCNTKAKDPSNDSLASASKALIINLSYFLPSPNALQYILGNVIFSTALRSGTPAFKMKPEDAPLLFAEMASTYEPISGQPSDSDIIKITEVLSEAL